MRRVLWNHFARRPIHSPRRARYVYSVFNAHVLNYMESCFTRVCIVYLSTTTRSCSFFTFSISSSWLQPMRPPYHHRGQTQQHRTYTCTFFENLIVWFACLHTQQARDDNKIIDWTTTAGSTKHPSHRAAVRYGSTQVSNTQQQLPTVPSVN